jgi:hypothetical protein
MFLRFIPKLIQEEYNRKLIEKVTEQEILEVLHQMNSDTAPGPDSFLAHLYILFWNIIKIDLVHMIQYV